MCTDIDSEKEIRKRFEAFLSDPENQEKVERALAVEFLLGNPRLSNEEAYRQAIATWEHAVRCPPKVIMTDCGSKPYGEVRFLVREGTDISMRVELYRGRERLLSTKGTPAGRRKVEKSVSVPVSVLRERARACRQAVTMGK